VRAPAELRAAEPEILDLVAWISNMGCRRFLIGTRASLEGRRVPIRARPTDARDAYRVFYRALQSLSPGLTVVPAGDDLRITESAPPPLAAARNRLHVGPG
jgi:hypothetical protein